MAEIRVRVKDSRPRPKGDGTTAYCPLMEGAIFRVLAFLKGGVGCLDSLGRPVERDGYLISSSVLIWDIDRFEVVEGGESLTPSQLVGFKSPRPPKKAAD